jgi:hypothetical protein
VAAGHSSTARTSGCPGPSARYDRLDQKPSRASPRSSPSSSRPPSPGGTPACRASCSRPRRRFTPGSRRSSAAIATAGSGCPTRPGGAPIRSACSGRRWVWRSSRLIRGSRGWAESDHRRRIGYRPHRLARANAGRMGARAARHWLFQIFSDAYIVVLDGWRDSILLRLINDSSEIQKASAAANPPDSDDACSMRTRVPSSTSPSTPGRPWWASADTDAITIRQPLCACAGVRFGCDHHP